MDSIEVVAHQLTEHALAIHRNVINHEGMMTPPETDMIKSAHVQAMLNLMVELEPGDQQSASKKVLDRLEVMPLNRDSERMIFWMMTDIMELTFPRCLS
jgi:hypothetical protein